MSVPLLNAAGRRRAPVTLPGYLAGRPPRNKGLRYPPDPPTVEEIVAVMRHPGDRVHGARLRAFIVLLWRAGLRINEALTVTEHDLEPRAGSVLVRHGKGAAGARSAWTRGAASTSVPGSSSGWQCRSARCCA
jgi:integrase